MESIWKNTAKIPKRDALEGEIKTDVLIIGAGITGILCGYMLRMAGVPYVIAEADSICSGITENTTAKITFQHGLIYDKLIRKEGIENAGLYLKGQKTAMEKLLQLLQPIDCDLEESDAYVYSMDSRAKIEKETAALQKLGINAEFCENTDLPFAVAGAVKVTGQAHFHPLKALAKIASDLNIYENTKVTELTPFGAVTDKGRIKAKKIIVATHFPFLNKHGSYFLKMYQHRSYVIALKGAPKLSGMYVDEKDKGLSFRNYKELLLLGGGDHRTGKKGGGWKEIKLDAERFYPGAQVEYMWATQDCMTLDGIPYIGQYSKNTPDLLVATGFNKWGMTSSMLSAMMLCDMVVEKENEYSHLFSPSRSILHPQLAVNAAEAIIGLLTPTVPRCPHMGCVLKYNREEHSWDCPCHGSRFSENGNLINGPATGDKKIK